jgi:hypothetical protein
MTEGTTIVGKGAVEGLIDSLLDRQSQLDVRLNALTLSLAGTHLALQLSGTLTVSVHMRELTDKEKTAHVAANVAHIRA